MQAFSGLFDGPMMIAVIYPGSLGKHQLGAKANGTSPPHNCGLIIVLQCSVQVKHFCSLAVQGNK